ncbi:MAG: hypothetical protein PHC61_01675 [Chitinivibrionales bacterium]|nr:hypothetical protein [Chitinivibrionales bacterium]
MTIPALNHVSQEQELALFLNALGLTLPSTGNGGADGYVTAPLGPAAGAAFESRDNKAAFLGYRLAGKIYPLSIHFLCGQTKILFGHSTLLLDSYGGDSAILPALRAAVENFFSQNPDATLRALEPSWADLPLHGQIDKRILWHQEPALNVAIELFKKTLGAVPIIPLLPSVYSYNNPYVEALLEVGFSRLSRPENILVLGSGAGLDAALNALRYRVPVHATDINPLAVLNTQIAARRCGVEALVRAWVCDGVVDIQEKYDAVFFEAPLVTAIASQTDANRFDHYGQLLRRVLADLPAHLNPNGRMYLMSLPDISPFMPGRGLTAASLRVFSPKTPVAIHEISLEK